MVRTPAKWRAFGLAGAARQADLRQGTPVHVHLAPDALRVLAGDQISANEDLETEQALTGQALTGQPLAG